MKRLFHSSGYKNTWPWVPCPALPPLPTPKTSFISSMNEHFEGTTFQQGPLTNPILPQRDRRKDRLGKVRTKLITLMTFKSAWLLSKTKKINSPRNFTKWEQFLPARENLEPGAARSFYWSRKEKFWLNCFLIQNLLFARPGTLC